MVSVCDDSDNEDTRHCSTGHELCLRVPEDQKSDADLLTALQFSVLFCVGDATCSPLAAIVQMVLDDLPTEFAPADATTMQEFVDKYSQAAGVDRWRQFVHETQHDKLEFSSLKRRVASPEWRRLGFGLAFYGPAEGPTESGISAAAQEFLDTVAATEFAQFTGGLGIVVPDLLDPRHRTSSYLLHLIANNTQPLVGVQAGRLEEYKCESFTPGTYFDYSIQWCEATEDAVAAVTAFYNLSPEARLITLILLMDRTPDLHHLVNAGIPVNRETLSAPEALMAEANRVCRLILDTPGFWFDTWSESPFNLLFEKTMSLQITDIVSHNPATSLLCCNFVMHYQQLLTEDAGAAEEWVKLASDWTSEERKYAYDFIDKQIVDQPKRTCEMFAAINNSTLRENYIYIPMLMYLDMTRNPQRYHQLTDGVSDGSIRTPTTANAASGNNTWRFHVRVPRKQIHIL